MADIQLALYHLEGYEATQLKPSELQGIVDAFAVPALYGIPGEQFGLWQPQVSGQTVWGRFIHQTSEALTDYRPTDQGVEQVPGEAWTFEHYWFVVWFDSQVVLLELTSSCVETAPRPGPV